jgi:hypothetical protein
MDSSGLTVKVGIDRADDDPVVCLRTAVQMDKVSAIQGQNRTPIFDRRAQHVRIQDGPFCLASFLNRNDIVA